MKHSFVDRYSECDSPVHRLDPRAKLLTMVGAVIVIVLTPPRAYGSFFIYACTLIALFLLARVPLSFALKRVLLALPFIILVAASIPFIKEGEVAGSFRRGGWEVHVTYEGLILLWGILIKSSLSILCMAALSSTTRFDRMLKGLESLHCPRLFLMVLAFMYRYLFLLSDDLYRMLRARSSRGGIGGSLIFQIRTLAGMLGLLFIRAYERAERVYLAMCSRGFDGSIPARGGLAFRRADILFICCMTACFGIGRAAGSVW
ncbi:MAG: cobalt ECF transporter T component CbiQ [Candidatus Aureabacteria bacterium]|nr:cobalt ECF transporter T component CbiQ [Candidatus Auribacterota bacterium]